MFSSIHLRRGLQVAYRAPQAAFRGLEGVDYEYFLYSFEGQSWRKLDDFSHRSDASTPPVILNGVLHWIVNCYWLLNESGIPPCNNSVMMFNMDTEEFRYVPHPGVECSTQKAHRYVWIFEMKGKLAFCHVCSLFVYVWVLEDYENWIWVERYSVNLHLDVKCYPFDITHVVQVIQTQQ